MKSKEEIEQLAKEVHYDSAQQGLDANGCFNQYQGFIKGYTQCQEDMDNEIQSLIDMYNSDILKLEEDFKDTCSVLTLEEISTLKRVITDLKSKFKQD
jgi:hypothetical protein